MHPFEGPASLPATLRRPLGIAPLTVVLGLAMLLATALPGCTDHFNPKEYGEIEDTVPSFNKDGRPYPLPALETVDEPKEAAK